MMKKLLADTLAKVQALEGDETWTLTVEEAGVLQAYLQAREHREQLSSLKKALLDRIRGLLATWQESADTQPRVTTPAGSETRSQFELRAAIDKLLEGAYGALKREEIQLARGTYRALSQRQSTNPGHERLIRLLGEALEKYDRHLEAQAARHQDTELRAGYGSTTGALSPFEAVESGALPAAPAREVGRPRKTQQLVAEECFQGKQRKTFQDLSGIAETITARVFEFHGDVEVTGDVPDDVLMVVHNGGATIHGYVFGHVVASEDISITGNIQHAWVISSNGNITADRVLSGAKVVAQMGKVSCGGAESPGCIFAGNALTVHGNVTGGKLLSRAIHVEGTVTSAELHGAGSIKAERFEMGPRQKMVICLRKTITSQDYGRPLDESALAFKRAIGKYGYQIAMASRAVRYIRRDVINCFRSMLYYLLAGVDNHVTIRLLRALQTQTIYLEQVIAAADNLRSFLHAAREGGEHIAAPEIEGIAEECLKTAKNLEKEIVVLPEEYGMTTREPLIRAVHHLSVVTNRIIQATKTIDKVSAHLKTLDRRLEEWRNLLEESSAKIRQLVDDLGLDSSISAKIEGDPNALEPMLAATIAEAKRDPDSDRARRARSPVMNLMQATVDRHRKNVKLWLAGVDRAMADREVVRTELARDSSILLGDPRTNMTYARATHYDQGVVLTATPDNTDGIEADRAEAIRIGAPIDCDTMFVLQDRLVYRMTRR